MTAEASGPHVRLVVALGVTEPEYGAVIARELRVGEYLKVHSGSAHDSVSFMGVIVAVEYVPEGGTDHVVTVDGSEFSVMHPLECRPELLACAVHQATTDLQGTGSALPTGRYRVRWDDDGPGYVYERLP